MGDISKLSSSGKVLELKSVTERQIISNVLMEMKVDIKEIFLCMCDDKLFKFQWQILRPWLQKNFFGPGFFYVIPEYNNSRIMPDILKQIPCNKKIWNPSNVWFTHEDVVIFFFYYMKAKFQ